MDSGGRRNSLLAVTLPSLSTSAKGQQSEVRFIVFVFVRVSVWVWEGV